MTPTHIGPYRIDTELGVGGMGTVFRAFDERLDRPVAVKQVSQPVARRGLERDRLWREARATARLTHPAVVQVFDIIVGDEGDWIVMELIDGRNLARLLADGPLDLGTALPLLCDVAEALAEAHEKGILHRDLKTENVMVTEAGRTKLLDFGLAQPIVKSEDDRLTVEGRIVGTPHAMSPEQAMSGELDHRSDLFSLGTLMYETLTGERPFRGGDLVAVLHRVCVAHQPPAAELNAEIPGELSRLIDKLLEKDPEQRPQDTREVVRTLQRLAGRALAGSVPQDRDPDSETPTQPATAKARDDRETSSTPSGERRQLTVVQCQLASGATPFGALEPEDLIVARPRLQQLAHEVTGRYGGFVGEVRDQGLRLLFGHPRAYEDDARRAILAALEIADGIRDRGAGGGNGGGVLALRVGVHTGPAVVAGAAKRQVVLGETATVAAALASLATPDSVLLSTTTHVIVAPFVRTESMPAASVPGLAEPLAAHRLLGEVDVGSMARLPARATPMVARQQELELLLERWQLATEGTGQVVLLGGEAGIGKTRLAREFHRQVPDGSAIRLWCRCSPLAKNTPFAPIVDLLGHLSRPGSDRSPGEAPDRQSKDLAAFLRPYEAELPGALPILAALLGIPAGASERDLEHLGPQAKRRLTLETLVALLQQLAAAQPVLMVMEDIHWLDPSTRELLGLLVEQVQGARILLLLTTRPDGQTPWGHGSHVTQLTLSRLNRRQVGELIRRLGGAELPASLEEVIAGKTDGVPLFVEEVTRAVLETPASEASSSGTGSYSPVTVPVRIQDLLTARLDRLGEAKVTAQQAAALGRTFSAELLGAVSLIHGNLLDERMERLVAAEVLFRRGVGSQARYTFKHALIQDAAYLSLLRSERRELHGRIAGVYERLYPAAAEEEPELLAHHLTEADQISRAIPLWLRAARREFEQSADAEAVAHFDKSLQLLEKLPASREREAQELDVRLALGRPLTRMMGAAAPEVRDHYRRAEELGRHVGSPRQRYSALDGLFRCHLVRGEVEHVRPLSKRLMRLARDCGEPTVEALARQDLATSLLYAGDFASAGDHYERSLAHAHAGGLTENGIDSVVIRRSYLAAVRWYLGYPDQALEQSRKARSRAAELGHPFSQAVAGVFAAWLHTLRREPETTREICEAALAVSTEQQFSYLRILGQLELVSAQAALGEPEVGLAGMRRALDAQQESGALLGRTYFLVLLVETMRLAQREPREALEVVDESLAQIEARGERLMESEARRIRGELLLALAAGGESRLEAEAERCFRQALDVARLQGARSLELRAALSLARLWQAQERRREASELLSSVYGWFSEGFDTVDLQEAKALLEELSAVVERPRT